MGTTMKATTNPHAILSALTKHPAIRGDGELLWHLDKAKTMLTAMAEYQLERIVSDELAGAVATIIGTMCCKGSTTPNVMVTTPENKLKRATALQKVIVALGEMGYISYNLQVVTKQTKSKYFCLRRFKQAQVNGDNNSENVYQYETVDKLGENDAKKFCVQTCSRSCKYFNQCKYDNH